MFCEKCGARVNEGDTYCPECGARIENDETVRMGYQSGKERRDYYQNDHYGYDPYQQNSYQNSQYRGEYQEEQYGRDQRGGERQRKPYRPDEEFYRDDYRKRNQKKEQDHKDNILYIFLGILTVVLIAGIIWGVVTLMKLNDDEEADYENPGEAVTEEIDPEIAEGAEPETEVTVTPEATVEPEIVVTPEVTEIPTPIVTQAPVTPVPTYEPDVDELYVLPDSSWKLLTNSDLVGLSEWELRIARNEIYARHGRMFKDSALDSYFRSQSWYVPSIPADAFDDNSILSKTELKNAKLISDYEAAHGYN